MIPLQEIKFELIKNNKENITVFTDLKKIDAENFTVWTTNPYGISELYPLYNQVSGIYKTPKDAFITILNTLKDFCSKEGYKINYIDNPYNCEFLSVDEQKKIVDNISINIKVNSDKT